jgi:GPI mannosyltransferase 3
MARRGFFVVGGRMTKLSKAELLWLVGIVTVALAVRVLVVILLPNFQHPDEIYQFFEQSHRIAFGYGLQTWEFREGMRSLLLPAVFSQVFALVAHFGGGPRAYILISQTLLAVLSTVSVVAIYFCGLQRSRTHAVIAASVAATWFELVFFAGHALTESIAANFLLIALAAGDVPEEKLTRRRLFVIGFCLATCLMIRVHLAPGLMVAGLWIARDNIRARWVPMLLGAVLPIACFGLSDWITWGSPFHSQIAAFRMNVVQNKASFYGVQPIYWYALKLIYTWGGALPIILALIAVRYRTVMMWLLVAAAIIVSHTLIGHKEYRFIFPATACLAVAAALSTADLVEIAARTVAIGHRTALLGCAIVLWVATSFTLAFSPTFRPAWRLLGDGIGTFFWLAKQPNLCGLWLYDYGWWQVGGYSYLHRHVPIYDVMSDPSESTINYIMLRRRSLPSLSSLKDSYTLQRCTGYDDAEDLCVAVRQGTCAPDDANRSLQFEERLGFGR